MSLAQIGEFSFIIAGVGIATGATDKTLYSVAVAVSGITTLLTPWLIRSAEPTAAWVDRKLPRPLQTFAALYGSWIVRLSKSSGDTELARRRSLVRWLVVDAVLIGALIIGASIDGRRAANWVLDKLGLPADWATALVVAGAGALCLPFVIGLVRVARVLGFELALRAFPAAAREQLDLAAAPRRLLVVTLQLAILVLIGAPLVAITQPFVPPFRGAIVLVLLLLAIAVPFWRSATNLQGHTRAAAQVITESLSRQTRKGRAESEADELERVLVGLGSPVAIELPARSPAAGKTLAEIKLRGLTGATVLAIRRGNESVVVPSGHERLQAGDLVAIAGTDEAVNAARQLLESTT
jgi:CPA2 family monovalent cation:H+ antiporter-2